MVFPTNSFLLIPNLPVFLSSVPLFHLLFQFRTPVLKVQRMVVWLLVKFLPQFRPLRILPSPVLLPTLTTLMAVRQIPSPKMGYYLMGFWNILLTAENLSVEFFHFLLNFIFWYFEMNIYLYISILKSKLNRRKLSTEKKYDLRMDFLSPLELRSRLLYLESTCRCCSQTTS